MLHNLMPAYTSVKRRVLRAARCDRRSVAQAWTEHTIRIATQSAYAAATTVLFRGVFGVVPVKEVLATVLAALLGVHATGPPVHSGRASGWHGDPFNPVDLA